MIIWQCDWGKAGLVDMTCDAGQSLRVVLAMEDREGASGLEKANRLKERFERTSLLCLSEMTAAWESGLSRQDTL